MYDWTSFDVVFRQKQDYSIDNKQFDAIIRERREFGGVLFFDKIWASVGLSRSQKSYPPKSNADLRTIWSKVISSSVTDEKKQAILLYILRDCSVGSGSKVIPNLDKLFAEQTYLPQKYQVLISGLWELDHVHFPKALEYLTDPVLTADFADDVLVTLIKSTKCNDALAMAYYIAAAPPLTTPEALHTYFGLLVRTNVVEAYTFAQKQDSMKHRKLFEEILRSVHEEDNADTRADRAVTMLSLPMTDIEHEWLEQYLLHGPGAGFPGATDSVIMRRMATGKNVDDFSSLSGYHGTQIAGLDWNDIRVLYRAATSQTLS